MSLGFGAEASSANVNAAFVSKTVDDTKAEKLGLTSTDPLDGDALTSVQKEINNMRFKPYAEQIISAGGTITTSTTKGMQKRKVLQR